jgi:hypothetical protein
MNRPIVFSALLFIAGWVGMTGCESSSNTAQAKAQDVVIADKLDWLKDGEQWAFKLEPGRYKVEMTASADGASAEWVGCSCPGSGETKSYSTICDVSGTSQLVIKNPTGFGMGASVSVTVKITKLAA